MDMENDDPRFRIQQTTPSTVGSAYRTKPKAPRFAYVLLGDAHWVSPYKYRSADAAAKAATADLEGLE